MKRTWIVTVGVVGAAGMAHGQVVFEPIADGIFGISVSQDGNAIAGNGIDGLETFRWTPGGGVEWLGRSIAHTGYPPSGTPSISADGTRVSATVADVTLTFKTPGLWVEGQGWTDCFPPALPDGGIMDNSYGSAWGMSGDGSTVCGLYWRPGAPGGSAWGFNWHDTSGATSFSTPGDDSSRFNCMNYDGTVSAGWQRNLSTGGNWQPTVWVNGVATLLHNTQLTTMVNAVTADGTVCVGDLPMSDVGSPLRAASMWTFNGSTWDEQFLGDGYLPGTPLSYTGHVFASGVSDDARVVVGYNRFNNNGPFSIATGFVWTPRTGMLDVVDLLTEAGFVMPAGVQVSGLSDISGDGSTIIGHLQEINTFNWSLFRLIIPTPCSGADVTTQGAPAGNVLFGLPDGVVSGADINFYVNAWIGGDLITGDVTTTGAGIGDAGYGVPDGFVTGADIQYYVNQWVAGCP